MDFYNNKYCLQKIVLQFLGKIFKTLIKVQADPFPATVLIENCSFCPLKMYLEYLDKMRRSVEKPGKNYLEADKVRGKNPWFIKARLSSQLWIDLYWFLSNPQKYLVQVEESEFTLLNWP